MTENSKIQDKGKIQDIRRKLIQIAAFGFTNSRMSDFATGKLYTGRWKNFCAPGLNCYSCPAATLSCPVGALQAVNGSMRFDFSFYVIGILLAFGVLLGRAVCAFLCPFGLFQELLYKIKLPGKDKKKRKLPAWSRWIKYIVLFGMVLLGPVVLTNSVGSGDPLFCKYICPAGTLEGGIPLILTHPELRKALGWLFSWKMAVLIAVVTGSIFVQRFFCKILCPLGAFYAICNHFSFYHISVDQKKCIHCDRCEAVCPMDVDPVKTPCSGECICCGRCAAHCPASAITLGYGKAGNTQRENGADVKISR